MGNELIKLRESYDEIRRTKSIKKTLWIKKEPMFVLKLLKKNYVELLRRLHDLQQAGVRIYFFCTFE